MLPRDTIFSSTVITIWLVGNPYMREMSMSLVDLSIQWLAVTLYLVGKVNSWCPVRME